MFENEKMPSVSDPLFKYKFVYIYSLSVLYKMKTIVEMGTCRGNN